MSRPFSFGRRTSPKASPAPKTLPELVAAHERVIIIAALSRLRFDRQAAAKALGVSRVYLWRRIKILGIDMTQMPRSTGGRPKSIRT
jgi:DNA-binding NtrC family response regulator